MYFLLARSNKLDRHYQILKSISITTRVLTYGRWSSIEKEKHCWDIPARPVFLHLREKTCLLDFGFSPQHCGILLSSNLLRALKGGESSSCHSGIKIEMLPSKAKQRPPLPAEETPSAWIFLGTIPAISPSPLKAPLHRFKLSALLLSITICCWFEDLSFHKKISITRKSWHNDYSKYAKWLTWILLWILH